VNIKDLAVAKELSHEERAAVRGGFVVRKTGGDSPVDYDGGGSQSVIDAVLIEPGKALLGSLGLL